MALQDFKPCGYPSIAESDKAEPGASFDRRARPVWTLAGFDLQVSLGCVGFFGCGNIFGSKAACPAALKVFVARERDDHD